MNMPVFPAPIAEPAAPKPARKRRLRWRIGLLSLGLLLALFLLLTRGFVGRELAERALAQQLGADVRIERLTIGLSGTVEATGVTARVPGLAGSAGEVLSIERVRAQAPILSWLSGSPSLREVIVDRPHVRLSQDTGTGKLSLSMLRQRAGGPSSAPERIPRIELRDGTFELGEHAGTTYTMLKSLSLSGTVEQVEQGGQSIISFRQGMDPGMLDISTVIAHGSIDEQGVRLVLRGIDLEKLSPSQTPSVVRSLMEESRLRGRVPQVELRYAFDGAWRAIVQLDGVGLDLPIEARDEIVLRSGEVALSKGPTRRMRLMHTTGTVEIARDSVTGDLRGSVEEFPYRVSIKMDSPAASSAFTVTLQSDGFLLEQQPQVLRFVPPVVRERLADFGNPTGIVDARVVARRAGALDGSEPPPIEVSGTLTLRDVRARFHKFPYDWGAMRGTVEFNEKRVLFKDIQGTASNGARLLANVLIEPPDENAGVDVRVAVRDLPLDERVGEALAARGMDTLLDELLDASAQDDAAEPLGGLVDVDVLVKRHAGEGSNWDDRVDILLPRVRLLPRALGLAVRTQNLRIVQTDGIATVSGALVPPTGGLVEVDASVDPRSLVTAIDTPDAMPPRARIRLHDVPVNDDLLATAERSKHAKVADIARSLRLLGASGTVAGEIAHEMDTTSASLRVRGSIDPGGDGALRIEPAIASITLNGSGVEIDASGILGRLEDADGGADGGAGDNVRLSLVIPHEGEARLRIEGDLQDLTRPFDRAILAFAPKAAERVRRVQDNLRVSGLASVRVECVVPPKASARSTSGVVSLTPMGTLSLAPGGHAFSLQDATGSARVLLSPEGVVQMHLVDVAGTLAQEAIERLEFDAVPPSPREPVPAVLSARGTITLDVPDGSSVPAHEGLIARVSGVALDGTLLRGGLVALGRGSLIEALDHAGLAGEATIEASVAPGALEPTTVVTPTRVLVSSGQAWHDVEGLAGHLRIDAEGTGTIDGLSGVIGGEVSLSASGGWSTIGASALDVRIDVRAARGLTEVARGLLPGAVASTLRDLKVVAGGPLVVPDLRVRGALDDGQLTTLAVTGTVGLREAGATLGLPISKAAGEVSFASIRQGDEDGTYNLIARLPDLSVQGVRLSDGEATMHSTPGGGVAVPGFVAYAHGGRLAGDLRVQAPIATVVLPGDDLPGRWFDLALQASNVRFASMLAELRPAGASEQAGPDESRGMLSGSLTLSGRSDRTGGRRGRGSFTVRGGEVLNLPVVLPLLRVTNLELPTGDVLDYALADFYLQDDLITLEQMSVSSPRVGLYGFGTASWPELELDLRFRAGNRARIPVLTAILEDVRDELVSAQVRGTLEKPDASMLPLSGTRSILRDLVGRKPSEREERLRQIEDQLSAQQRRVRPFDDEIVEPRADGGAGGGG